MEHDTAVVPPSTNAASSAGPDDGLAPWGWLKTPKGWTRLAEWLFSVIMFATMADVNGFDNYSEFKYQVACGVLVWLYVTTIMLCYIFRRSVERHCLYMPVIELAFDGIFCVMLLAAGAAAASQCNKDIGPPGFSVKLCSDAPTTIKNKLKSSIVFAFFTLLAMIGSTWFSYKENVAEERKR